ncbi:hypothetical protein H920_02723 [Fukomys damarensis]|uniref:Uncharacterized protein n=1 Tax=Fukomys damarensis TaxID=885580 RepID=A0A091EK08_FUKDA|nr:hypothetical protein H920_02723 [Fukomys damarensis]
MSGDRGHPQHKFPSREQLLRDHQPMSEESSDNRKHLYGIFCVARQSSSDSGMAYGSEHPSKLVSRATTYQLRLRGVTEHIPRIHMARLPLQGQDERKMRHKGKVAGVTAFPLRSAVQIANVREVDGGVSQE